MIELNGHIDKDGKPTIHRKAEMEAWFTKNAGKDFKIKVERKYKKRSDPQNRYYFGVVVPLIRERLLQLGNDFTLEETHEALKAKFNVHEILNDKGVSDEIVKSTAKLRTIEFMEYLDRITMWAAQFLGITIPAPNEQLTIDSIVLLTGNNGVIIAEGK